MLVFVVSTTGLGEVPDNGRYGVLIFALSHRDLPKWALLRLLLRRLKKAITAEGEVFSGVKYALLGLGDSNYDVFNGGCKKVEKLLKKAGARSFLPTALADDGIGSVFLLGFIIKTCQMQLFYGQA